LAVIRIYIPFFSKASRFEKSVQYVAETQKTSREVFDYPIAIESFKKFEYLIPQGLAPSVRLSIVDIIIIYTSDSPSRVIQPSAGLVSSRARPSFAASRKASREKKGEKGL
jgi:hypothetical protein